MIELSAHNRLSDFLDAHRLTGYYYTLCKYKSRIAVFKQVLKLQLWSVIAIAQNLRTDHAGYFIKKHILISKFKVLLPLRVLQQ